MMNDFTIETIMDGYLDWYKSKMTYKQLKNAEVIITPFVNYLNDRVVIFIELLEDGKIRLSDDGVTLNELNLMNINPKSKTRKRIIDETIRNFGITLKNDILFSEAKTIQEFPQAKHNLLQSILRINDLVFTEKKNVKSLFNEEVLNFLFDHDFGGNVAPQYRGESNIVHSVDYSLGATKKRPNILFKFQKNPSFENIASQKFIVDDLSKESNLKINGFKYVMITEKKNFSSREMKAADYSNIELIPFTNKKELLKLK